MKTIDIIEARARVKRTLQDVYGEPFDAIALQDELTQTEPWGWVFFYDTRAYVESGNPDDMLLGNAPYVVTRAGEVHATGTAQPLDAYIAEMLRAGFLGAGQ